ncbi:MAG: type II toxin-antitoxin system RelE family toxin [Candidatus Thorarchaeota archaeon]
MAFTRDFLDGYESIRNQSVRERIKRGTEDIAENPLRNSIVLSRPLVPIRRRRFGKWRVFYQPCDDCRLRRVEQEVACIDCESHDDSTVVFFYLSMRDKAYDHKKKSKLKRRKKKP